MPASPERTGGDRWAELLGTQGWWVQKLPASTTSGVPDWLRGHVDYGLVWTEAKTVEAVEAKGPRLACTVAQRFWLNQVVRYRGRATLLVVAEEGWMELEWQTVEATRQRHWVRPGASLWQGYR